MSSAILYLAIVAIWAFVLVPRWLRPRSGLYRQSLPARTSPPVRQGADMDDEEAGAGIQSDAAPARTASPAPSKIPGPATAETGGSVPDGEREHRPARPEMSQAPLPDGNRAAPREGDRPGPRTDERAAPREAPGAPVPQYGGLSSAVRRARMLQARRRTLGTLVLLTLAAVGLALTRLAPGWIIAPPTLMLAGFLVLLREAALIDAERKSRHTRDQHGESRSVAGAPAHDAGSAAAGEMPGQGAAAAGPGRDAEPAPATVPSQAIGVASAAASSAHVLHIAGRIDDEPYDQYTDAVERAVGD